MEQMQTFLLDDLYYELYQDDIVLDSMGVPSGDFSA